MTAKDVRNDSGEFHAKRQMVLEGRDEPNFDVNDFIWHIRGFRGKAGSLLPHVIEQMLPTGITGKI